MNKIICPYCKKIYHAEDCALGRSVTCLCGNTFIAQKHPVINLGQQRRRKRLWRIISWILLSVMLGTAGGWYAVKSYREKIFLEQFSCLNRDIAIEKDKRNQRYEKNIVERRELYVILNRFRTNYYNDADRRYVELMATQYHVAFELSHPGECIQKIKIKQDELLKAIENNIDELEEKYTQLISSMNKTRN